MFKKIISRVKFKSMIYFFIFICIGYILKSLVDQSRLGLFFGIIFLIYVFVLNELNDIKNMIRELKQNG